MILPINLKWTGTLRALFENAREQDASITEDEFVNALIQFQLAFKRVTAQDLAAKVSEMRASERRLFR